MTGKPHGSVPQAGKRVGATRTTAPPQAAESGGAVGIFSEAQLAEMGAEVAAQVDTPRGVLNETIES
jgi:hypothetical protein